MDIRFYFCFCFSLFIILNVSDATAQQQNSVKRVCGKPAKAKGFIVNGADFKRGEFPWMVAMLNKLKNPAEFFCAGTLISTRHVITGKKQMHNRILSFGDKI